MFSVLVADPPWPEKKGLIPWGSADSHYNLMTLVDIKAFGLPELQRDCWLFLWCPQRRIKDALEVMQAWAFKDTGSALVWCKQNAKNGGQVMGLGYYFRMSHEFLLLGKRGKPKPLSHSIRSIFFAPRGRHSEKPDEAYRIIERFSNGPYCELFARKPRPGWTTYGKELAK